MTEFKHKNMTGSLLDNNFKERDNQPDMTGKLVIDEKTYQVAGWKNQTKNGGEYIKISVSDDEPQRRQDSQSYQAEKSYKSVGQSIPSKHLKDYQDKQKIVKEALEDQPIISDDEIPF